MIQLSVGNFRRYEPFSVALWLKTPDLKERAVVFHRSGAWTDAGSRGYELLIENGRLSAALVHFWPGNAIRIQAIAPLPVDVWTHVVLTYGGGKRRLFVNGKLADEAAATGKLPTGTVPLTVGGGAKYNEGFSGWIDEVAIYRRALSEAEVNEHRGIGSGEGDEGTGAFPADAGMAGVLPGPPLQQRVHLCGVTHPMQTSTRTT